MARGYSLRQDIRTGLQTRVDPQLVLVSQLLELSHLELESKIERELEENPALERLDDTPTGLTSTEILQKLGHDDRAALPRDYEAQKSAPADDVLDPIDLAKSSISLHDHLLGQLARTITSKNEKLIEFIVYGVDERGYLESSVEEIALACEVSIEDVEDAIRVVQACDPPGVAATSVPECLALQIAQNTSAVADAARRILAEHMDEFLSRSTRSLSRKLNVTPAVVEASVELIMSLDPYPASEYAENSAAAHNAHQRPVPELVIERTEQGWSVTVQGSDVKDFCVNRHYSQMLGDLGASRSHDGERSHLSYFVTRARRFLDAMHQRQVTLQKIGATLIREQESFLTTGEYRFLNDLTQAKCAASAGLHESTISRATSGKFVQIPSGELVPFEVFFDASLRIKKMIQEILNYENPARPYTDDRIRELLLEQGVSIARRTVHKYREEFRTLSSRLRRSA